MSDLSFNARVAEIVARYRAQTADPDEHLSLLRWQLDERHALDSRETYPGHVTTSAIILSPDGRQTLLIDHQTLKRWLQPGGHYETAAQFWISAQREAVEETGLIDPPLHPWHNREDRPFLIDSHEVPGKASRGERPHVHHDLQFLFVADPAAKLTAQMDEVNAARWFPISALSSVTARGLARLTQLGIAQGS